jgi:hypothetical protein
MPLIRTRSLAQLTHSLIPWLWEPYLPKGRLALIDGDPGIGKSLLTIDIAARLSRGGELPNGVLSARRHTTILLGKEDNSADTIGPRAAAAGADPERVIVPDEEDASGLSFPRNAPDLEELIRAHAADLVVIDPIVSFLPSAIATTTDHGVRKCLEPLGDVTRRTDCTIILVRHLRKSEGGRALYRGLGSIGFIAAARAGLFASRHPLDPTLNLLAVSKANSGNRAATLGYRIKADEQGRPVVEWTGAVELSADAANRRPEAPVRMRDRASTWLAAELANGPRRATAILAAAAEVGIPERTLERAKSELRIGSRKVYGKDERAEWYWYDPASVWPNDAPFKKPRPGELPPIVDYIT